MAGKVRIPSLSMPMTGEHGRDNAVSELCQPEPSFSSALTSVILQSPTYSVSPKEHFGISLRASFELLHRIFGYCWHVFFFGCLKSVQELHVH